MIVANILLYFTLIALLSNYISASNRPNTPIGGLNSVLYNENEAYRIFKVVAAGYANNSSQCIKNINKNNEDWEILVHKKIVCMGIIDHCTFIIVASKTRQEVVVGFRGTDSSKWTYVLFGATVFCNYSCN